MTEDDEYEFGTDEVYDEVSDLLDTSLEELRDAVKGEKTSPLENARGYFASILEAGTARSEHVAEAYDVAKQHYDDLEVYDAVDAAEEAALQEAQAEAEQLLDRLEREKKLVDAGYKVAQTGSRVGSKVGSKAGEAASELRDTVEDSDVADTVKDSASKLRDRFGI